MSPHLLKCKELALNHSNSTDEFGVDAPIIAKNGSETVHRCAWLDLMPLW